MMGTEAADDGKTVEATGAVDAAHVAHHESVVSGRRSLQHGAGKAARRVMLRQTTPIRT